MHWHKFLWASAFLSVKNPRYRVVTIKQKQTKGFKIPCCHCRVPPGVFWSWRSPGRGLGSMRDTRCVRPGANRYWPRILNTLGNTHPDSALGGDPPILTTLPFCNSSLQLPSEWTYECLNIITPLQGPTSCSHHGWCYLWSDLHSVWISGYRSKNKDLSLKIVKSPRQLLIHVLRGKKFQIFE